MDTPTDSGRGTIRLTGGRSPTAVPWDRVYFTFASGRLDYDCVSCGARCCRGQGYALRPTELDRQITQQPLLASFVERDEFSGGYIVRNCPPSCFFLNDRELCQLHVDGGPDAKPETCRLFPFNNFRYADGFLIVAPHLGLCPLEVVSPGRTSVRSRHEHLLEAMSGQGVGAPVPMAGSLRPEVASVIELERSIVHASEEQLDRNDYLAYATRQDALTRALTRRSAAGADDADADLRGFVALVCRVLGVSLDATYLADAQLVQTFVALTPVLRSQFVFGSSSDAVCGDIALERVPRALLVLYVMAALARQVGMRRVTYQTLTHMLGTYQALATFLACADCDMVLGPAAVVDFPLPAGRASQSSYVRVVKALLPARQRAARLPLGEILCNSIEVDGLERLLFLKQVAARLAGRIAPVDCVRDRRVRRFRPALQRWALRSFSDELLVRLASSRLGGRLAAH